MKAKAVKGNWSLRTNKLSFPYVFLVCIFFFLAGFFGFTLFSHSQVFLLSFNRYVVSVFQQFFLWHFFLCFSFFFFFLLENIEVINRSLRICRAMEMAWGRGRGCLNRGTRRSTIWCLLEILAMIPLHRFLFRCVFCFFKCSWIFSWKVAVNDSSFSWNRDFSGCDYSLFKIKKISYLPV